MRVSDYEDAKIRSDASFRSLSAHHLPALHSPISSSAHPEVYDAEPPDDFAPEYH